MNPSDPVLLREVPIIQKIIQDETWLEGERRGCWVSPADQVVLDRVCAIILRIGQDLRDSMTAALGGEGVFPATGPAESTEAGTREPR